MEEARWRSEGRAGGGSETDRGRAAAVREGGTNEGTDDGGIMRRGHRRSRGQRRGRVGRGSTREENRRGGRTAEDERQGEAAREEERSDGARGRVSWTGKSSVQEDGRGTETGKGGTRRQA